MPAMAEAGSMRNEPSERERLPAPPDDQALVARVRAGEHAAYETLFRTYAPALFRVAYGYVRSDDVAKDVVQDVMLAIWKNRTRWQVTESVQSYLHAATRKRALKALVADSRAQKHEAAFALEDDAPGMGHDVSSPDAQAESRELIGAVVGAVERLPERYRRVLMLRAEAQMTYPEIAALLGLPLKTVKTQARRGLERLQRMLKPYFPET
jgi:RNA polymerase sigma-70 factor (ECF subfamily)